VNPVSRPAGSGVLPMFKAKARPTHAEPVGRYAIRFVWNDGHEWNLLVAVPA